MNTTTHQPRLGFAVVYRWKVYKAKEEQFKAAWEDVTKSILKFDGGLGSRLHRASDGTWMAYAQWPSREAWEKASTGVSNAREAMDRLTDSVEERLPYVELEPVADYLIQSQLS